MNRMLPSAQLQRAAQTKRKTLRSNKPAPLALEARLMFDGAAIATDRPVAQPDAAGADAGIQPLDKGLAAVETPTPREAAVAPASVAAPREIVFVDPGVTDWQQLLKGKPQDAIVIMLDPARDGLAQMAEALKGQSGIDAIHVISHGSDGRLILGGKNIDQAALAGHQTDLQTIGQALGANGDILLYGCDIARGSVGAAFVDAIAEATAADVAASTDATGSAAKGGDWNLEYAAGPVETKLFANLTSLAAYDELLANKPRLDLDKNDSSGKTGLDYETGFYYLPGGVKFCDSDAELVVDPGRNVAEIIITIDNAKTGDKLSWGDSINPRVGVSLSSDSSRLTLTEKRDPEDRDILLTQHSDWIDALSRASFSTTSNDTSDRILSIVVRDKAGRYYDPNGIAAPVFTTIKIAPNTEATISEKPGADHQTVEAGLGVPGDQSASGTLNLIDPDLGHASFRVPANLNGTYGSFAFNVNTGAWTYTLDNAKADSLSARGNSG